MVQRFIFLILLCVGLMPALNAAEAKKPASAVVQQVQKKPQKSAEEAYLDALVSLQAEDGASAAVILAGLNPTSPYAKLLKAQIAALNQDFETPLRLLIPLQAEAGLIPQAIASLHATLALAYEAQGNVLNALEQRVRAEPFLAQAAVGANQDSIWRLVSTQPREVLVEMRGESPDPVVQGWIDLGLAVAYAENKARNIEQWRTAYPDHPAPVALLEQLAGQPPQEAPIETPGFSGKVALLLPLESEAYGAAAQAVQAGVMAALAVGAGQTEIVRYATGGEESVASLYRRAVAEGASFVIGPLTRDEVTQLAAEPLTVPVLALNQPEGVLKPVPNLSLFGLPVENEARQVARLARNNGMQSALVVAAEGALAERMAKAFAEEWRAQDGSSVTQLALPALEGRGAFKAAAAQKAADMIFLAMNAAEAQEIRPWLDAAIPTYGTSHVFDGRAQSILNQDLLAVHFVDLPWLVQPDKPDFAGLQPVESLAGADQKRLYALGLDAFRLVAVLAKGAAVGKLLLDGATGRIILQENNVLARELLPAQFRREGVVAEDAN